MTPAARRPRGCRNLNQCPARPRTRPRNCSGAPTPAAATSMPTSLKATPFAKTTGQRHRRQGLRSPLLNMRPTKAPSTTATPLTLEHQRNTRATSPSFRRRASRTYRAAIAYVLTSCTEPTPFSNDRQEQPARRRHHTPAGVAPGANVESAYCHRQQRPTNDRTTNADPDGRHQRRRRRP